MKRFLSVFAALLLLLSFLCGCSGKNDAPYASIEEVYGGLFIRDGKKFYYLPQVESAFAGLAAYDIRGGKATKLKRGRELVWFSDEGDDSDTMVRSTVSCVPVVHSWISVPLSFMVNDGIYIDENGQVAFLFKKPKLIITGVYLYASEEFSFNENYVYYVYKWPATYDRNEPFNEYDFDWRYGIEIAEIEGKTDYDPISMEFDGYQDPNGIIQVIFPEDQTRTHIGNFEFVLKNDKAESDWGKDGVLKLGYYVGSDFYEVDIPATAHFLEKGNGSTELTMERSESGYFIVDTSALAPGEYIIDGCFVEIDN